MPRSISASVGRLGGVNRPPDVVTVQELLNRVPPQKGGPAPPLVVDGRCGPLTIKAIQTFQLHHFSFRGMDGRVDPGGQTLRKLNEFERTVPKTLVMRGVLLPGVFLDPGNPNHWFFQISDPGRPDLRAVYHLGSGFEPTPKRVPPFFVGDPSPFQTKRGVSELGTRGASYLTKYNVTLDPLPDRPPPELSRLNLVFLVDPTSPGRSQFQRLEIFCSTAIEPPPAPSLDRPGPNLLVSVRTRTGEFTRVS
jgi:hypothetical protein